MKIEISTDKIPKYASGESGDSFELSERPRGGISAILADGQGSGKSAKLTSSMVAAKAAALIADGTRDGAVSRATHDFLYAQKDGRVSCTLNLLSCDLSTKTLVISRNSNCPTIVKTREGLKVLDEPVKPIGFHYFVKPTIDELDIDRDMVVLTFTDGIYHSGRRYNDQVQLEEIIHLVEDTDREDFSTLTEEVLQLALSKDKNRPQDDMSVLALGLFDEDFDHKPRKIRVTYTF